MNQGLVRQINDIVRPYREARMGLLIVISDPVGQRGPTPPLAWQYMIGRNWYKHTIHGTASVNGVHGQQPVEMTLFAWPENRIADWHSVVVGIRNSMGILACSACRLRGTPRCFVMIMARCGMAIT